ncbi:MAG TPA: SH3 domain-containing protein [Thermomicrobiales bacterium]|nr:SH3 domain-containing protein [Thermomicrobiales bacterium]
MAGSPVASPATAASPAAVIPTTTSANQSPPAGGATPTSATPVASPEASPASGTPAASTVVTSCDPDVIPPFTGDSPDYVTSSDLNFRAGPGSDCDLIGDPLAEGVALTVLSDPVTRQGEDGQWVQVNVDGQLGWVSSDYIEPASGN